MGAAIQLRAGDTFIHLLHVEDTEFALRLLEHLDGSRNRDALIAEFGSAHAVSIDALLGALDEWLWRAPHAFDYLAQFAGKALQGRVLSCGHAASAEAMRAACRDHELAPLTDWLELAPGDLIVCAIEAPDLTLQRQVNERAVRAGVACLFVDLSHGQHATLGPLYVPGESSCLACFRARLLQTSESPEELQAFEQHMLQSGAALPSFGVLPAHRQWVLGMTMSEVVAFFSQHRPLRTLNRAVTISFEELRVWSEPVWPLPHCEACGHARA